MKTKKEIEHLKRVASLGWIICDSPQVQVHHIRPIGTGIGRRSSHFDTIPGFYVFSLLDVVWYIPRSRVFGAFSGAFGYKNQYL